VVTFDWDGVSLDSQLLCLDNNLLSNATYFLFNFPLNYTCTIVINVLDKTSASAVFSVATTSTKRPQRLTGALKELVQHHQHQRFQHPPALWLSSGTISQCGTRGTAVVASFTGSDFQQT